MNSPLAQYLYVWSAGEFGDLLGGIGFRGIRVSHWTKTHYAIRDMGVVAHRPAP